jgi:hypothetical protein
VEEIARQNTINLNRSGIPSRMEKAEKKIDKMDGRLTSTQVIRIKIVYIFALACSINLLLLLLLVQNTNNTK